MTEAIVGPAWIPGFLAALAETGKAVDAIKAANAAQSTIYSQRRKNRRFAQAWAEVLTMRAAADGKGAAPGGAGRKANWQRIFFDTLAETSNVTKAAEAANTPTQHIYKLRREDGRFAARWLVALAEGYSNLEMELLGYLRDPKPKRKMDVANALRLLAAHRKTVAQIRALEEDEDEQAVLDSIDAMIDAMRREAADAQDTEKQDD